MATPREQTTSMCPGIEPRAVTPKIYQLHQSDGEYAGGDTGRYLTGQAREDAHVGLSGRQAGGYLQFFRPTARGVIRTLLACPESIPNIYFHGHFDSEDQLEVAWSPVWKIRWMMIR